MTTRLGRAYNRNVADRIAELLVKEGVLSAAEAGRAASRQEEAGGAFDTALLELELVGESRLEGYLARASGLPAAPDTAWGELDARARRVFPAKVAERHGIAPFALEGRDLSVVATYPPDLGLLDEISFMLSLHLKPHVAVEWRVRDLIHRLYGTPLPLRLKTLRERGNQGAVEQTPDLEVVEGSLSEAPTPPADPVPTPASSSSPRVANERSLPLAKEPPPAAGSMAWALPSGPSPEAPGRDGGRAAASPGWTLGEARAALASASDRDEVILAALRYLRDFFEYAAVFAVTRDALYGHEAVGGDESARDECRRVAVELSDPGFFRTAIETRGPYLGPPTLDPVTASILSGLRRGTPRTVLLHPVFLRDRPVCVFYADNGGAPVSARRLGDLFLVLGSLGPAFERVIRERKLHPPPGPGEETWRATEPALAADDGLPFSVDVDLGDYEVAPASEAFSSPLAMDAAGLVKRLMASARGSAERSNFIAQLRQRGHEGAAPLVEALPGPIEVRDGLSQATPVEEQGPVLAALAAIGTDALGPLLGALADSDPERRRYAVLLVARLGEAAVLPRLAARVFDEEPPVAAVARQALARERRRDEMKPVVESLRQELSKGNAARAAQAARALAELGDAESVSLLIQLLEGGGELGAVAADSLAQITLQRLGTDPEPWLSWWQEHRATPRSRWLLEALTSPDRELRQVAAEELRHAGAPPVPYFADAPAPEREKAAQAWADWWQQENPPL